jgi:tetratricopeptide (TPR) repeat protein
MSPSPVRRSARSFRAALASCLIIAAIAAQEKPPGADAGPAPEEREALAEGAKELGAYAALAQRNGFPRRAREVWLEVIGEYATDDEDARKALGFVRNGTVWQRDPKFVYPEQEQPNASIARMLEQRWSAVAKKLGDVHRELAAKLEQAGRAERAAHHLRRALRFQPNDGKALAASGLKQIEGITGNAVDLELLRRSRMMDRAIARLTEQSFPTKPFAEKDKVLDKAGVPYVALASENFVVFGDYEPEVLQTACAWAERAAAFCKEAFDGCEGFPARRSQIRKFAVFKTRDTWRAVVRANADAVGKDRVEFVVENTSASRIGDLHTAGFEGAETIYDLVVREVVQDYVGVSSAALNEGVGHAIVGMFFGRNLIHSIAPPKPSGGTAATREDEKFLLPDLETWRELALELAWSMGGTSAARLPLLQAAKFPTDGRVKAWSFCDYLVRRDPVLLKMLDRTTAKARTEGEVAAEFLRLAKLPLADVEDGWRRFWTEDTPLKRAILDRLTPLESTSKDAAAWLEAFNIARKRFGAEPVGWSSTYSTDCRQHADYLKANKDQRGPAAEHTQIVGKPGASNSGRTFAQLALVSTREKDPRKAIEGWVLLPGYRDALLNRNIETVGVFAEGPLVVIDATRGRIASTSSTTMTFPYASSSGGRHAGPVPSAVDVDLLGPEVQALLKKEKRDKEKQIGFPLSLHLYGAARSTAECKVTCQGEPVHGWLTPATGANRRTSAPGMWVFYPAEPLKRGVDITAAWTWDGGKHTVTFITQ